VTSEDRPLSALTRKVGPRTESAAEALEEIIDLLVAVRELLGAHDQSQEFRRFGNLGLIATEGEGTADERLRRIWRSRMRLDHPDGILDLRILRPDGTEDPVASRELVRLCDRLDEVIEEWGPPEAG
jgi:hypothetical protein